MSMRGCCDTGRWLPPEPRRRGRRQPKFSERLSPHFFAGLRSRKKAPRWLERCQQSPFSISSSTGSGMWLDKERRGMRNASTQSEQPETAFLLSQVEGTGAHALWEHQKTRRTPNSGECANRAFSELPLTCNLRHSFPVQLHL